MILVMCGDYDDISLFIIFLVARDRRVAGKGNKRKEETVSLIRNGKEVDALMSS